jgi:hypothetical protein
MNADEIYEQLEASRERLLLTLELIPLDRLAQPGVMGKWSVTDVLTHFVVWESELVTCMMNLDQGKKPARMLAAIADVDGYNARRYEENKDREFDRVLDDLRQVRIQLEEWLPHFSDRDLNDVDRYKWSDEVALWQIIEANSFGHEGEHLPDLEAYASQWQDDAADN